MLMTVANAFLLCLAKAAHMVTMEICSYHAVITGRCSVAFIDISQVSGHKCKNLKKKHARRCIFLSEYDVSLTIVENCMKICKMTDAKYYFPFISRRKISPQSPITLAAGSHLFKGKSSIQKPPDQCI